MAPAIAPAMITAQSSAMSRSSVSLVIILLVNRAEEAKIRHAVKANRYSSWSLNLTVRSQRPMAF